MGGDYGPAEIVAGAVKAVREGDLEVLLVGDQETVLAQLATHQPGDLPITVVPSHGVIEETDHPLRAMRDKPEASMVVAARLVKEGRARAMVSMGSTGAIMAVATLSLGLLEGVERPALGGPLLGSLIPTVILDLGSNVDCRPSQLVGFGAIGAAFARSLQGIENPRVALLSVGTEDGKGNRQTREAFPLFQESGLNFVGNLEGGELFMDRADVVVCDGFVGNILMKFAEGLGMALAGKMSTLLGQSLPREAVPHVEQQLAAMTNVVERGGGGPLLGVDGVAIIGHGRARAASVASSISMAQRAVDLGVVEAMRSELATLRKVAKE
jgi:glycerol-3-phosphate acyltransferase PlsX